MTHQKRWLADRSVWHIAAANALTLLIALVQGWGMLNLLWPLWLQSLVICWYGRRRILRLQQFCTDGFVLRKGQRVAATPAALREVDRLFVLTYGAFHLISLLVMLYVVFSADAGGYMEVRAFGRVYQSYVGSLQPGDWPLFVIVGACFAWVHGVSHREHVAADLRGVPRLGTLFYMHLQRIGPMSAVLIAGMFIGGGAAATAVFMLFKTVADVGMHIVEHRVLGGQAERPRV